MDDARLAEIAQRLEATTPGPWRHGSLTSELGPLRPVTDVVAEEEIDPGDLPAGLSMEGLDPGCHLIHTFTVAQPYEHVTEREAVDGAHREWSDWLCRCEADARFLAHARQDIADLLAEVRRAREALP